MTAQEQIDKLVQFISEEVNTETSQNEGTVDTAIRIIRNLQLKIEQILRR